MVLNLITGNRKLLKHAKNKMIPLYRFLKSQLSQDFPAVASFSCDIDAMPGKACIFN